tara:strand:+ start:1413 stop:1922 length:510 start_codon:yes stop_codon:yes gene_type:complete
MAKARSGKFQIRKTLDGLTTGTTVAEIDLGAYVDPADAQGVEILMVDFIWHDGSTNLPVDHGSDFRATAQLKDNINGNIVGFENTHLVASAALTYDAAAGVYNTTDIFPDILHLSKDGGRICVNDVLEFCMKGSTSVPDAACTVVIDARIVGLTKKDYMALALTTVASE